MNLGHAFRLAPGSPVANEVEAVLKIVAGDEPLAARTPIDSVAVRRAEKILRVKGAVVYSFAGCLHPKLGTIGLIIRSECSGRLLQGTTKCDSGGLAGRYDAFTRISENDVEDVLLSLSYIEDRAQEWVHGFNEELDRSYPNARAYIAGDVPSASSWRDARADCLAAYDMAKGPPDRRLWTWEVRLHGSPHANEFIAMVFSHEAFKHLELLRAAGMLIPGHVRIVVGDVTPAGVHYFSDKIVQEIFCA